MDPDRLLCNGVGGLEKLRALRIVSKLFLSLKPLFW